MPGGNQTIKRLVVLAVLAVALIGMAGAANYMYEKASVKSVGYKNVEMIVSTQTGFNGQKLVEKEAGSGNVITEKTELEAERQLERFKGFVDNLPPVQVAEGQNANGFPIAVGAWVPIGFGNVRCDWPTGTATSSALPISDGSPEIPWPTTS